MAITPTFRILFVEVDEICVFSGCSQFNKNSDDESDTSYRGIFTDKFSSNSAFDSDSYDATLCVVLWNVDCSR